MSKYFTSIIESKKEAENVIVQNKMYHSLPSTLQGRKDYLTEKHYGLCKGEN